MVLMLFEAVLLRTRRALSLYKVYDDNALLVLNPTSLKSTNALLVLSLQYDLFFYFILNMPATIYFTYCWYEMI